MKTVAYQLKNITDLKEYDGMIFKGDINFNIVAKINERFIKGDSIFINTDICETNTADFLKNWGILYTRIINVGIN